MDIGIVIELNILKDNVAAQEERRTKERAKRDASFFRLQDPNYPGHPQTETNPWAN